MVNNHFHFHHYFLEVDLQEGYYLNLQIHQLEEGLLLNLHHLIHQIHH